MRVVLRVQRMLVSVGKGVGEGQGEGRFPAQGVHQAGLEEGVGLGEDEAELSTRLLGKFWLCLLVLRDTQLPQRAASRGGSGEYRGQSLYRIAHHAM